MSSNWCQEREAGIVGETRLSNRLTGCNAFQAVKIITKHRLRKGSPCHIRSTYIRLEIHYKQKYFPLRHKLNDIDGSRKKSLAII